MEKRELHYVYGISYLVIIIVALIAFALFEVESLVDKVSFALTITSLVLAILAIIYTYVAGARQENQLSQLLSTNQQITSASAEIKIAAAGLIGHVEAIPKGLQDINEKLLTLSTHDMQKVSAEVAAPASSRPTTEATSPMVGDERVDGLDDESLGNFMVALPFLGMTALYAFMRAYQTDNEISVEWLDQNFSGHSELILGIFYGARGAGYIDFKAKGGIINPSKCSDVVIKNIKSQLGRVISVVNEAAKTGIEEKITLVERTFTSDE